jgi:hypothetical protein
MSKGVSEWFLLWVVGWSYWNRRSGARAGCRMSPGSCWQRNIYLMSAWSKMVHVCMWNNSWVVSKVVQEASSSPPKWQNFSPSFRHHHHPNQHDLPHRQDNRSPARKVCLYVLHLLIPILTDRPLLESPPVPTTKPTNSCASLRLGTSRPLTTMQRQTSWLAVRRSC